MRRILSSIFFVLVLLFCPSNAYSQDLLSPQTKNNKFGIHILDESDLTDAATLVNSGGGKWGYVTIVIREDERNVDRWKQAFTKMRELSLIPIVRISTVSENGVWKKPSTDQSIAWADFLHALPWPTKNQYVVLFNEPNHAKEWGGEINPQEYARIARAYWEELKKVNPNFFVLPAGFDAAAPNSRTTMSTQSYFDQMYKTDEYIFTIFDGWTSHSYPNPGFSGNPSDNGKMTIRGYEWEINYLAPYHLPNKSPVFITETGWVNNGREQEKIADYYKQAFTEAWSDYRVVAVTPFLLRYDQTPFKSFSWKIPGTNNFYPYFQEVLGMSKIPGEPEITD